LKAVGDMNRVELAAYVGAEFEKRRIHVVLSGGSCVSVYSDDRYVSMDLDFVNAGLVKRSRIREAMEHLGFVEDHRYFRHPETPLLVEFPPGPLGVGDEPVRQIDKIQTSTGIFRILSPTDCVKDRLAGYYHWSDLQCLEQAILVTRCQSVDLTEIERWSINEKCATRFEDYRRQLFH